MSVLVNTICSAGQKPHFSDKLRKKTIQRKICQLNGGTDMAVSLRERPVIIGKDAKNFFAREQKNNIRLQKKAELKKASSNK